MDNNALNTPSTCVATAWCNTNAEQAIKNGLTIKQVCLYMCSIYNTMCNILFFSPCAPMFVLSGTHSRNATVLLEFTK